MILEEIRNAYASRLTERLPTGNPTGSRFGVCTAQLQFLQSRAATPAPWKLRSLMVFEEGQMIEEWWARQLQRAIRPPRGFGMRQEAFYFPVELDEADCERLEGLFHRRERWGRIIPNFRRPLVTIRDRPGGVLNGERRLLIQHQLPRDDDDPSRPQLWGFILDPVTRVVHAPVLIDFLFFSPDLPRPTVLEAKSMSNRSFQRALLGVMGYYERCQLVGEAYAVNADVTWLLFRKETAHLVELTYTKAVDRTYAAFTKSNGQQERYISGLKSRKLQRVSDGELVGLPEDDEWDVAHVWTPWDSPQIVVDIKQRIRLALLASVDEAHAFKREWGPVFECRPCGGTGRAICKACKGTRASTRSRPVGKICKPCLQSTGLPSTVTCRACKGVGTLEESTLPQFPCGYCPVVGTCYPPPLARLDLSRPRRPRYLVTRQDWERSGLTFSRPRFA